MHPSGNNTGNNEQSSRRGRRLLVGFVLGAVYLVLRLPGLMDLPIFGDEAIYLRWAQLVREGHVWESLIDPKPPLHFWLLSLVVGIGADPLMPARVVSVLAGLGSVWLMLGVGGELGLLGRKESGEVAAENGWAIGLLGSVLMIFCPFLAFYQRLATADALFVADSLVIVWLSLRWGRMAVNGERRAWWVAAGLGLAIGTGLMTRQGVSYTLCAMPAVGYLLHACAAGWPRRWGKAICQVAVAGVVAAAIWSPYLLAQPASGVGSVAADAPPGARVQEIKRRVFYQDQFTQGSVDRVQMALRNAKLMFWPGWEKGMPVSGWFFLYLTPVVYALCLAGVVVAAVRAPRLFWLLVMWLVLVLGPLMMLANVIYSRYVLAGAAPLLFGGAFLLVTFIRWIVARVRENSAVAWIGPLALLAVVVALPLHDIAAQGTHWADQTLTVQDDYQYIRGWTAGYAAQHAVKDIKGLARVGPVVVITDNGWGTPADAVWADLIRDPNVHLYYSDDLGALTPIGPQATVMMKENKWLYPAPAAVKLADFGNAPVLVVTKALRDDGKDAMEELPLANPNLSSWRTFKGVERPGKPTGEGVAVFSLRWKMAKQGNF